MTRPSRIWRFATPLHAGVALYFLSSVALTVYSFGRGVDFLGYMGLSMVVGPLLTGGVLSTLAVLRKRELTRLLSGQRDRNRVRMLGYGLAQEVDDSGEDLPVCVQIEEGVQELRHKIETLHACGYVWLPLDAVDDLYERLTEKRRP